MPLGMLGKYERLDVLGHGASGIVYLAKDTLLGRLIALKEISAQGEERERVLEEARVLDRLRHQNIVQVYGVDEIDSKIVLAMEYVRGSNLQDILRKSPELPPGEAVSIAEQICDGLAFAHSHHVIHRDIKPANILIDEDGTVKLVDFGLAQVLGTNSLAGGAGTYAYMAPEDFHEDEQSDYQTDIWAVGVMLFEMLVGRRPFQAAKVKDPFSWKRAIEEFPIERLSPGRSDIPPELDNILSCALAKNKKDRYSDAAQMAEDLRALPLVQSKTRAASLSISQQLAPKLVFPNLPAPTDIDTYLKQAQDHWEIARETLANGALAEWLKDIDELPLAEVAHEMARDKSRDGDELLREFLYRAGLDLAPEAHRDYDSGSRLARAGRFAEAIPLLKKAADLDPNRPIYHEDYANALRASGDGSRAVNALQNGLRYHPQHRNLQKKLTELGSVQTILSSDYVDFGTVRHGHARGANLVITNLQGGPVEGRITAAPGWLHVSPSTFASKRRQRLTLRAESESAGATPAEYHEKLVIETLGGRHEIALRLVTLRALRSFSQIFFWYLPLFVTSLLPCMAGWLAPTHMSGQMAHEMLGPSLVSSNLLFASLFVLTVAAETTMTPRLFALLAFALTLWGVLPLANLFASGIPSSEEVLLVQAATPAVALLALFSWAHYHAPNGWGRWQLWVWIIGFTGILISYGLLHVPG